jgi:hypothetical protein
MNECYEYIEELYQSSKVNQLISNIKPVDLQNELKQEVALYLLEYDCNKLIAIKHQGKLINFVLRIIWNMGTMKGTTFYRKYKRTFHKELNEYVILSDGDELPDEYVIDAISILENKLTKNPNEAHESIIFQKYVELESCQKVADYFGIPRLHVFQVVNNVKLELKKKIRK